jgi:hypothetical protein
VQEEVHRLDARINSKFLLVARIFTSYWLASASRLPACFLWLAGGLLPLGQAVRQLACFMWPAAGLLPLGQAVLVLIFLFSLLFLSPGIFPES